MNFNTFNFHPNVVAGITAAGYETPTPIQVEAIPAVMQGHDVMGLAQTGTGKTAVFVLPILHRLLQSGRGAVRALIVAPTRELAEQINEDIIRLGQKTGLRSLTIYGGVNITPQIAKLKRGVEIVVACPGRLLDHLRQGTIDLSHLEVLVLDEADNMFDMGFLPDIRRIISHTPKQRQTLLFSATMPNEIRGLVQEVLNKPVTVQVGTTAPAVTVSHATYPVPNHLKTRMLLELLKQTDTQSVLVFTRTKHRAKRVAEQLEKKGFRATSLQGNLSQNRRQAALNGFRDGTFPILVATDIAARGIDVSMISHVINYDVPDTPDAYIHRIGRTGRAARNGDAFTLVTDDDLDMVRAIERILGGRLERRIVEGFDYEVPVPKNNQEFARPPMQPRVQRKKTSARPTTGQPGKSDAQPKSFRSQSSDRKRTAVGQTPPSMGSRQRKGDVVRGLARTDSRRG
ncbi:MAG: RNA helicase [Deltaproteobacteria bacterium RIFOXYD12_FULL_50_9]|nr:MAG: RNA helicase [Deltaproteobacteria bacterium RIFOXYD12_FULL_50_9]